MRFNWQLPDWPHFRYDLAAFDAARVAYARFEGRLQGLREALPDGEQREAALRALVLEALKTSAIEGELLAPDRPAGVTVAVSHVSPIKAAAAWAMGVDDSVSWRMHLDPASITAVVARGRSTALSVFNDTAHLSG